MCKIPFTKAALKYKALLLLLKNRGLSVADEPKALFLLEKISYYRLSGYWFPLLANKKDHFFKPSATCETAFKLYSVDKEL
jgi:abortive infection bacteriophage resistance protein